MGIEHNLLGKSLQKWLRNYYYNYAISIENG